MRERECELSMWQWQLIFNRGDSVQANIKTKWSIFECSSLWWGNTAAEPESESNAVAGAGRDSRHRWARYKLKIHKTKLKVFSMQWQDSSLAFSKERVPLQADQGGGRNGNGNEAKCQSDATFSLFTMTRHAKALVQKTTPSEPSKDRHSLALFRPLIWFDHHHRLLSPSRAYRCWV